MSHKVSFCGYFCPAAYSLTGRLIDRLESHDKIFLPIKKNASLCSKLAIIIARCISAVAVAFAALADILWWIGKTLITDNLLFLEHGNFPTDRIANLATLISCFAGMILSISMPFGYLPQVSELNGFFRLFTGSPNERNYLHQRFANHQFPMYQRVLLFNAECNYESEQKRGNYQFVLDHICSSSRSKNITEKHVKEAYQALVHGANPNESSFSLQMNAIRKEMDDAISKEFNELNAPANPFDTAANPFEHPLTALLMPIRPPEEFARCIRIAKMLIYAGSRLPPGILEDQTSGRSTISPEKCEIIQQIYNETLLEIENEKKVFAASCSANTDLSILPTALVQIIGEYWIPPLEKFLTPNVA